MVDGPTSTIERRLPPPGDGPEKTRFLGVDVARGIALITMLAANVFSVLNDDGKPTLAAMTVTGRSATLFVMVAGISLAFISGGRFPVRGRARRAAAAAIAVRALLIGVVIGLPLGNLSGDSVVVILPYYGLYFLLAIPLLGLRPRTLACIAGALTVVGPLLILASIHLGLQPAEPVSLTLGTPFTDPVGFVLQLFVSGYFPAVVYMAYICAGLAIGRMDLTSTKVAGWLLGGGLVLAVTAWFTSSEILFRLGGLRHLLAAAAPDEASDPVTATNTVLWDGDRVASWWWLAVRSHHSGSIIDALHTLGVAMAVLGGVLLLMRLPAAQRWLWPLGVAGSMTLTIYTAHVPVLTWWPLVDGLGLYVLLVVAAISFAVVWKRFKGQGPLERWVALGATRARRAVMNSPAREPNEARR